MSQTFQSWVLVTLMAVPVPALADALTLNDAIRSALVHNPELQVSDAGVEEAEARAKAARGAFLPRLELQYLARRSDNPLDAFADKLNTRSVTTADFEPAAINQPGTSSVRATQLRLEIPVYTGGRLAAGAREARARADGATLTHDHQRRAIAYRALESYRRVQAAALAVQIADDALAAARSHAETTARLVRQGRIVVSDRLTAELNQASVESMREQAAGRSRQALEELRIVTGYPAEREIAVESWKPGPPPETPEGDFETRALAQRRDLQALEAEIAAARARTTAARAAFHPQVGVVAADTWYDENSALDNKSQSIMGVVSVNLFNGGRDWHGLSAAQQEVARAKAQRDRLRSTVVRDVRLARSRLTEALARRRIAEQGADKAREAVRLIRQRYGEGRTILIDLLMAERLLVEARQEALNAALASELAVAGLQLADGSLKLPDETAVTNTADPGARQ